MAGFDDGIGWVEEVVGGFCVPDDVGVTRRWLVLLGRMVVYAFLSDQVVESHCGKHRFQWPCPSLEYGPGDGCHAVDVWVIPVPEGFDGG